MDLCLVQRLRLGVTKRQHCVCDFYETSDIGAGEVVNMAIAFAVLNTA
jgi:hypothetical protein